MKKLKNPIPDLYRHLWKYGEGHRKKIGLYLFMQSIASGIYMLEPFIIGRAFNYVQQAGEYNREVFDVLAGHLVAIVLLAILNWCFWGTARLIEEMVAFHVRNAYKVEMLCIVLHLPLSWHQENHSGKSIDKINRASESLRNFASGNFVITQAIWKLILAFIALFSIDLMVGTIVLVISVLAISFVMIIDQKIAKLLKKEYQYENKTASAVHDFVTNITTVTAMKLQKYALSEVAKRLKRAQKVVRKGKVVNEQKWATVDIGINIMVASVIIAYSFSILTKGEVLLLGTLSMIYGYLRRVADVFFTTAFRYSEMVEEHAKIDAAKNIVKAERLIKSQESNDAIPEWENVKLKNVTFEYKKRKKKEKPNGVFNVSLEIEKGKNIAFVGTSGSGKSTMMSVLKNLQEPQKGSVEIDGSKTKNEFSTLANLVSYIPQDPEIFQNTVRYNITMGKKTDEEAIQKVLRVSHFNEVLQRMKKDTSLNISEKGVSLSGGEKQRLSLARGLLFAEEKDIICLDEPTSSVDAKNELGIFKEIFKEYKNKTIIASVHRLHLLPLFDEIILFKEGKMLGKGTYAELEKNNKYFKHILESYKEAEEDETLEFA